MDVLRDAYELIKDYDRWTAATMARDADGHPVDADAPEATKWCARGAIYHAALAAESPNFFAYGDAYSLLTEKATELFGLSLERVNDLCGHTAVIQLFEKAIAETEGGL